MVEVGEGVTGRGPGDRVLAMTGIGGYSEQVVLDARRAISPPDSMSFDQAGAIPVTYGTAYHMLAHLGNLARGVPVLVHHAAGGVGPAAAQTCKAFGASLIVGTASAPKREFVESLGMRFVDRESEDFVEVCKGATGGKGVHHAIDPVGGSHVMRSYKALRRCGKLPHFRASSAATGDDRWWGPALRLRPTQPRFHPVKSMSLNQSS